MMKRPLPPRLTPAEREVFELIARGLSVRTAASELGRPESEAIALAWSALVKFAAPHSEEMSHGELLEHLRVEHGYRRWRRRAPEHWKLRRLHGLRHLTHTRLVVLADGAAYVPTEDEAQPASKHAAAVD
jgi:hypothetical protein